VRAALVGRRSLALPTVVAPVVALAVGAVVLTLVTLTTYTQKTDYRGGRP